MAALAFFAKAALPSALLVFDVSDREWTWVAFMLCYYGLVELLPTAYILMVLRASTREREDTEMIGADAGSPVEEELGVPLRSLASKP